jgi:hypothetical protein
MPLTAKDKALHDTIKKRRLPHQVKYLHTEIQDLISAGANVNSVTEEGSPLHHAVRNGVFDTVKLLVEKGADINLTDAQFRTAIDIAANNQQILNYLIENHKSIALNVNNDSIMQLSKLIEFCFEFYQGSKENEGEDKLLLDYAVSKLTRINIDTHRKSTSNAIGAHAIHWNKYIGHLRSLAAIDRNSGKVEGFFQYDFLPLRIRSFFEIIIKIKKEHISLEKLPKIVEGDLKENQGAILAKLYQELLIEIETLYTRRLCENQLADKAIIAKNILKKLSDSQELIEYCIASGWEGHSVYINLPKTTKPIAEIEPRVDNLGDRWNTKCYNTITKKVETLHQSEDPIKLDKIQPCILSPFHNNLKHYIENAIHTVQKRVKPDEGVRLVYNLHNNQLATSHINHSPFFSTQTVGNCTVEAHQVGLQIRLNHDELNKWLLKKELGIAKSPLESFKFILNEDNIKKYWLLENQPRGLPISLSTNLKRQYNKEKIKITQRIGLPLEKVSFHFNKANQHNLQLVNNSHNYENSQLQDKQADAQITLQNIFNFAHEPSKHILIVALPGSGKTTFCNVATTLWANNAIWPQFKWVFHISFRNLTKENYPAKNGMYTWMDIIRKECLEPEYRESVQSINQQNQDEMLIIADGFNELIYPPHLSNAIAELLSVKNIILTSTSIEVPNFYSTLSLELSGLSDQDIHVYLQELVHLDVLDPETSKEAKNYIMSNPMTSILARTPINLKLICEMWPEKFEKASNLYQEIFYNYLINYKRKLKDKYLERVGVKKSCRDEINTLGIIALSTLQHDNSFVFGVELIEAIISYLNITSFSKQLGIFQSLKPVDCLLKMGFLELVSNNKYSFFHPLIQSFIAANYIALCIRKGLKCKYLDQELRQVVEQDIKIFIALTKFNPKYDFVWPFVAGILSINYGKQDLEHFFAILQDEPYDIYGLKSVCLLMRCLEEANLNRLGLTQYDLIMQQISQWLEFFIINKSGQASYFVQQLNFCPDIALSSTLTLLWLKYLRHTDQKLQAATLSCLRLVKIALLHSDIIDALFDVMNYSSGPLSFSIINQASFILARKAVEKPDVLARYLKCHITGPDIYQATKRNLAQLNFESHEILNILSHNLEMALTFLEVEQLAKIAEFSKDFFQELIKIADCSVQKFVNGWDMNYKVIFVLILLKQHTVNHLELLLAFLKHARDYIVIEIIRLIGILKVKNDRLIVFLNNSLNQYDWKIKAEAIKALAALDLIDYKNIDQILTCFYDRSVLQTAYEIFYHLGKKDIQVLCKFLLSLISNQTFDYSEIKHIALIDQEIWQQTLIKLTLQYPDFIDLLQQALRGLPIDAQSKLEQKLQAFGILDSELKHLLLNALVIHDNDIQLIAIQKIRSLPIIEIEIIDFLVTSFNQTCLEIQKEWVAILTQFATTTPTFIDKLLASNIELALKVVDSIGRVSNEQVNQIRALLHKNTSPYDAVNSNIRYAARKTLKIVDTGLQKYLLDLLSTVEKVDPDLLELAQPITLMQLYIIRPATVWLKALIQCLNVNPQTVELNKQQIIFNQHEYAVIPSTLFDQFLSDWNNALSEQSLNFNLITSTLQSRSFSVSIIQADTLSRLKSFALDLIAEANPFDIKVSKNIMKIQLSHSATGVKLPTIVEKLNKMADSLFVVTDGRINTRFCTIEEDALMISLPSSDDATALLKTLTEVGFIVDGSQKEGINSNKLRKH